MRQILVFLFLFPLIPLIPLIPLLLSGTIGGQQPTLVNASALRQHLTASMHSNWVGQ